MQNIGQTYKDYKKELPKYEAWKKQRDIRNAKKEYLFKTKPPSEEELKRAKAKADILFNAIDVMDDYSQEKAEDTEQIVQQAGGVIMELAFYIGGLIGLGIGATKTAKNTIDKLLKKIQKFKKIENSDIESISILTFSSLGALMLAGISQIPLSIISAKCEVSASRIARFEAMKDELNDYNQFAILDDKQKEEVANLAQNIKLNKKEKKNNKLQNIFTMFDPFGPFKTVSNLLKEKDEINQTRKIYFDEVNKEIKENYNKGFTEEKILESKKDKELLTSMIENIDIKSQDYAENMELTTVGISLLASCLSSVGAISIDKLTENIKDEKTRILCGAGIPFIFMLVTTSFFTNIQKLSSKIARYKVIEEMKQNPANFVYYSEEEINSVDESKINVKKEEKDNIFKFIPKIIKEYKEYKKYVKENDEKDKKYNKALKQIEISKEQEKEAAKFQRNTFLTFNKIDDNSQKYSESIEARWEMLSRPVTVISSMIGAALSSTLSVKQMEKNNYGKAFALYIGGLGLSLVPTFILEMISTKHQKQASRVANYKAIEELKDYQNFA